MKCKKHKLSDYKYFKTKDTYWKCYLTYKCTKCNDKLTQVFNKSDDLMTRIANTKIIT